MKWRGPLSSLLAHGALAAVLLYWVKAPSTEAAATYLLFADVPPAAEPAPAASATPAPEASPAPVPSTTAPPRVAPSPARPQIEHGSPETISPYDFGVVLGGEGDPGGVVVAPSSAAAPGVGTPAQPSAPRAKPQSALVPTCKEALLPPKPTTRSSLSSLTSGRSLAVRGRLVLRVTVAGDGSVSAVDVVQSVDDKLDREAQDLVKGWRFEPGTRCGEPVPATYTLAVRFDG